MPAETARYFIYSFRRKKSTLNFAIKKVCVVGNPANTNALITMINAPSIPKENFTALTRLDHNRAIHQIAERTKTGIENIRNLIIWGNHSATQVPDVTHAHILDAQDKKARKRYSKNNSPSYINHFSTLQCEICYQ